MTRPASRILLFTDDPERGGVAQYNHSVLMASAAAGYEVHCVQSAGKSPLVDLQRAAGVTHHLLPYDTVTEFGRTLSDMDAPRALFSRVKPDFILFSDCCPLSNFAARQTALAMRIPYVVVIGFAAAYLAKQFAPCLPILARHYAGARKVVAVSEENLALLRSHFGLGANAGEVIHYGRPASFFARPDPNVRQKLRAELGLAEDAVVSLTPARLTKIKGYLYQLAALQALIAANQADHLHCVWLGEGEQRLELQAEIRRLGLEKRVTLLGHRWDTADWYDAADLFVLPTEHEGMPLAIMEAMAKGLPVAASAVSGIPEELGPTGRLLPDPKINAAATVRALAETWLAWGASPDVRSSTGLAARERAVSLFTEEKMLARTLALFPAPIARAATPAAPVLTA